MKYNVQLTGGYRSGQRPDDVHQALARLFRQPVDRVVDLIAAKATLKRDVDAETAEKYRAAIESAGAGCELKPSVSTATLDIDPQPGPPAAVLRASAPPDADEDEATVLEFRPSLVAFAGSIVVGVLLLLFWGVGVLVLLYVFLSWRSTTYRLTSQRLFARHGILSQDVQELELYRVKDVAIHRTLFERLFGAGTVVVVSTDETTPHVRLRGIGSPEAVKETIRTAYRRSRRREGVRVGERFVE